MVAATQYSKIYGRWDEKYPGIYFVAHSINKFIRREVYFQASSIN